MPVKTGRANENAVVVINYDKCNNCGLCIMVCKDLSLLFENGKVVVSSTPVFGCFACGQCVAVCPQDCITVTGRTMTMEDFTCMPPGDSISTYESLFSLMLSRRSIRDFKDKEIDKDVVEKLLKAASTSPMGIPPSDVEVLVLHGKEKVREFSKDVVEFMKRMKWMFSPPVFLLWRLLMKKTEYEFMKLFVKPLTDFLIRKNEAGEDWLLYNAPLAIYFYGSSFTDPADPIIPATYAMLAAESLGLGSCIIGSISPFIEKGAYDIKKKYGINPECKGGIVVIFGYPKIRFRRSIKRTFGKVIYG